VAVGIFGVSFGVLARSAGFGAIAPIVMSATTFAGSAQFAAVSIARDGGGIAAATAAAVLLNARYGPIGLSIAPSLQGRVLVRFLQSQLAVDESWAIANRGGGRFDRAALVGAGLALYGAWVAGTIVGVAGGDVLGDPEALGLDAAFPALFLALLLPQVRRRRLIAAAAAGAGIALVLVPVTEPGVPIIAASLASLAGWRRT
jgi:4-azaleucine resistance transporter AzlC